MLIHLHLNLSYIHGQIILLLNGQQFLFQEKIEIGSEEAEKALQYRQICNKTETMVSDHSTAIAVCLHNIGSAIGIRGHLDNKMLIKILFSAP